jgi:transcriptional regulator with XRE-family HTH domain
MSITDNIRSIRERKGLTQEALADLLKTTRSNYAYLENRGEKLTFEQIQNIANALGVAVSDIIGLEDQNTTAADQEKTREYKKKIEELEDRLNDKEFIIKNLKSNKFIFECLVFDALWIATGFKGRSKDYQKLLEDNPWLITLLSGILFNGLSVENYSWKNILKQVTNQFVKKVEEMGRAHNTDDAPLLHLMEGHFSLKRPDTSETMDELLEWLNNPENEVESYTYYWYEPIPGENKDRSYLSKRLKSKGREELGSTSDETVTP